MHIIGAHASPMRAFRETVGRQVASTAPLPSQQGGGGKSGLESCPAPRACLCSLHAPASLVPRALERGLTGRGSLPMGRSRRQHPIFRSAPTECRGDPDPQGAGRPALAPTPAAAPAGDPAPSDPTAPKFAGYDKIAVVNPPNDGTVWDNSGNVSLEIAVAPALQGTLGHKLRYCSTGNHWVSRSPPRALPWLISIATPTPCRRGSSMRMARCWANHRPRSST
jgi:hypothetical protein